MNLGKTRHELKYLAIDYFFETKQWHISWMCKKLSISKASYYKWKHREIPKEEQENIEIAQLVIEYEDRFGHILGYRRMTGLINKLNHTNYSQKRIHRVMKITNVHAKIRKQPKVYRSHNPETIAENILKRDFTASKPNEKWVTDVSEFPIPYSGKKLYLSAILDLYDRSIVAYELSHSNNNILVFNTFDSAIKANPDAKPLFHSDRGFQYTSSIFQAKLKDQGMKQSMSRVGCCIDNGPMEGVWGIIKSEMYAMYEMHDEASLHYAIENYIDFYMNERPQERFGFKTPMEVRMAALNTDTPVQYPIPVNKRIQKYKEKFRTA